MHRVRVAGRLALVVAVVVASGFAGWSTREGKPAPGREANVIPSPRRKRFGGHHPPGNGMDGSPG